MTLPELEAAGDDPWDEDDRVLGHEALLPQLDSRRVRQGTGDRLRHVLRERGGHCAIEEEKEPPRRAYAPDEPAAAIDARPLLPCGPRRRPPLFLFLSLSTLSLLLLPLAVAVAVLLVVLVVVVVLRIGEFALSPPNKRHRIVEINAPETQGKKESCRRDANLWFILSAASEHNPPVTNVI